MNETTEVVRSPGLAMQRRREKIVAAAEALIRAEGTGFSMLVLARRAKVSPATPYNLFGTKSAILYALLNHSADRMFSMVTGGMRDDPIRLALAAADSLAAVITSDAAFYRPLYGYLLGVEDQIWRPAFFERSKAYWRVPFEGENGSTLGVDGAVLGRLLFIQALGCTELWVHQEIEDHLFATELRRACGAILLGFAPAATAHRLRQEIAG